MRHSCGPAEPPTSPPPKVPGAFAWIAARVDRFLDILGRHGTISTDLSTVLNELRAIKAQGVQIMGALENANAAIAKLSTATTAVGNELKRLRDLLASGGLTAEQETAVFDQMNALSDSLIAMAPSAENPIPVPVPPPITT